MGLLDNLFRTGKAQAITGHAPAIGMSLGSPWPGGASIKTLVYSDHFGGELGILTRESAIQIPALARAHSLVLGVVANLPLRGFDAEDVEVTASWLHTTQTAQPIWQRMALTLDDIMFYGSSLWAVKRDGSGQITDASRIPFEQWDYSEHTGLFSVNGTEVPLAEVVYIPGPDEGVLAKGNLALKGALANMRTWVGRAQNPAPHIVLQDTEDVELEPEEIQQLLSDWNAARAAVNGSVSYLPKRLNVVFEGSTDAALLIAGREADVRDVARLTNVPASLLDGSAQTASLTYSNSEGRRNELLDLSLQFYTAPIESRLSMDDVTPPGTRIRFDKSDLVVIPHPTTDNNSED